MSNFIYIITDTLNTIRETILKCTAVFLVWFSIIFGVGMALMTCLKLFLLLF
jgi:hypothetical protein